MLTDCCVPGLSGTLFKDGFFVVLTVFLELLISLPESKAIAVTLSDSGGPCWLICLAIFSNLFTALKKYLNHSKICKQIHIT